MQHISARQLYARLYDLRVPDWPGEIDFYRELIESSSLKASGVLEIACGTGRVTLQLARQGLNMTGLDISAELLEMARSKSGDMPNVTWVLADMRTFELPQKFGFVISPGHSFQFMITPDDQVRCLEQIKRHMLPGGLLVIHLDHQDFRWLGDLMDQEEPVYQNSPLITHPVTGCTYRQSHAWTLERASQTATAHVNWEELDDRGNVIQTWKMEPMPLHCIFPFEMEHLFKRAGFETEAVYGDFYKQGLVEGSEQMIWLARNQVA